MQASRKTKLIKLVTGLFLCLIIVFIYVGFKMATWSPNQSKSNSKQLVLEGETKLIVKDGNHFWLTRLSSQQRQDMISISDQVFSKSGCSIETDVCQITAQSQHSAVLIVYVSTKPAQLSVDQLWFGGYVNPVDGAVYDLLGRGYLTNAEQAPQYIHRQD